MKHLPTTLYTSSPRSPETLTKEFLSSSPAALFLSSANIRYTIHDYTPRTMLTLVFTAHSSKHITIETP